MSYQGIIKLFLKMEKRQLPCRAFTYINCFKIAVILKEESLLFFLEVIKEEIKARQTLILVSNFNPVSSSTEENRTTHGSKYLSALCDRHRIY